MPPMISAQATITALPSISSIWSPSARPSTTAGMKATSRLRTKAKALGLALEQADEHVAEGPPVEHDDGEDRAGLDGDVEQRPFVGVEAEQLGREDQVAGRRDRQIFGDALDDAEDDDEQQDRHRSSGSRSG